MKPLWKHQIDAITRARSVNNLALFFKPGCGKTRTQIEILREDYNSRKQIRSTLIFSLRTVCPQWKDQFALYSKVPQERILVLTGTGKRRTDALLKQLESGRSFIGITNYEGVQIKTFYDALCLWNPEIIILDESQRVRTASGVRAKKIFPLCDHAQRKFILSGTPILGNEMNLFGQFRAMDQYIFGKNFFVFRMKYFYDKNAGMPAHVHFPNWQPRPEAAQELMQIVHKYAAKADECPDMPECHDIVVNVELSKEQERAYKEMKNQFVAELNGKIMSAEFAMVKTLRLQQLLAGYLLSDEEKEATWFDELPRLAALEDLLETLEGERVIVWTGFRPTYKKIGALCDKMGLTYVYFTGEQSEKEQEENKRAFKEGRAQVFIANPAAGGVGLDLPEIRYAIFYNKGYNLEHYEQSRQRNIRGGTLTHKTVTHYHIVCPSTLDEVISTALERKQSVSDTIMQWSKKVLDGDTSIS